MKVNPVSFDLKWKHLMDISLPDPNLNTPGNFDLLLGANIFNHGQQFGSLGSASAFKTCFEWVLASVIYCRALSTVAPFFNMGRVIYPPPQLDDLLKRFWKVQGNTCTFGEQSVVEHFHRQFQEFALTTEKYFEMVTQNLFLHHLKNRCNVVYYYLPCTRSKTCFTRHMTVE